MQTATNKATLHQQHIAGTQSRIIQMLGWNEMEYAEYMEEQGLEFLERYIPNDPHGINYLQRSKGYWQWWKNHWLIRDLRFFFLFRKGYNTNVLVNEYRRQNAAKYLVSDIYPPAVVLGNDFAKMIGELNDEIKR